MSPVLIIAAIVVVVAVIAFFFTQAAPKAFGDGSKPVVLHVPVHSREQVSHDTIRVKLALPSPGHVLGLPCGKHFTVSAKIDGSIQSRAYTPTSDGMRQKGTVDLVIKVYKPLLPRFPKGWLGGSGKLWVN
eukprot:1382561-Amorphochlora_amoeboformis.AAC.1